MARLRNRRPLFSRLSRDSRGATAVEYALILAAVALAMVPFSVQVPPTKLHF